MSQFLPEGSLPGAGVAFPFGGENSPVSSPEVTAGDIALMQRVLAAAAQSPNLIPDGFMAYVFDWIQTQRLSIPIGQVFGFSQFTATVAQVSGTDTTTSTSYVAPSVATGPTITGLSDGQYLVILKVNLETSSSSGLALASMSYNGSTPLDTDAAVCGVTTGLTSCIGMAKVTLSNGGDNSIDTQFRSEFNTVTVTLGNRTLIALKFAN